IPSLDLAAPQHHIRRSPPACGLIKVSRDCATRPRDGASSETISQKKEPPPPRRRVSQKPLRSRAAVRTIYPVSNVSFADLGLAEPLLRALAAAQYTVPTPIQARTIPALLQGRDVLGIAQTGTGK